MRMRHTCMFFGLGALALTACDGGGSVGGQGGGGSGATSTTTTSTTTTTGSIGPVDKIDLLLNIDNSRSMADKQEILSLALTDLVNSLTNPACVDTSGAPVANQPASGQDPCPAGSQRSFLPISDIHIGIVTTSIGGHGSDACPNAETFSCAGGATNTTNNDHGQLITRTDACSGGTVPTYQNKGFLAWDANQHLSPAGESDPSALANAIKDLVIGAGQVGCGYESQLESWYRFLVDPEPYNSIVVNSNTSATPVGIDNALLQQRAAFLRPDSLLAILMLSDENDCSTKEYGQFFYANQQRDPANPNKNFYFPKARSECATNPNDPCCRSCGQDPTGCPPDPNCDGSTLNAQTDDVNLRCFDQKRRFGIDFLYPIDRYVNALTAEKVPNRAGELVPNPIFSNLDSAAYPDAQIRDPGLVMVSGIVGVPWQDLARDPTDLKKGYKDAGELAQKNGGFNTWDAILGEPASYVPPLDPHMIESTTPRSGTNPITGTMLAPTTAPNGTNPINGHEYTPNTDMGVQKWPDDLQYACIFPLAQTRDCSDPNLVSCDCHDPKNDNPLCEPDPSKAGNPRILQVRAKAYPGVRQLHVIRELGGQGVASSICPAQANDPSKADYAYRPAIQALIARVATRLKTP
jgi:hypothetical protein